MNRMHLSVQKQNVLPRFRVLGFIDQKQTWPEENNKKQWTKYTCLTEGVTSQIQCKKQNMMWHTMCVKRLESFQTFGGTSIHICVCTEIVVFIGTFIGNRV